MIELRPGVKAEEFEKFITEEVYPLPKFEGWKVHILKEDRGDREGKYLLMFDIESIAARDRYYPLPPGEETEEARQFFDAHPEWITALEKWATLAKPLSRRVFTDYVVVRK